MDETHQPVKYLGPDDKAMSVKGSVTPAAQFVLCIRTPEKSLLDVIATIKQNVSDSIPQTDSGVTCSHSHSHYPLPPPSSLQPSYRNALDTQTRGYLVMSSPVPSKGSLKPKNCTGWRRYWCILDGSTLVCYNDEEDEGMKQFELYLDFRGASVGLLAEKSG